ncbi:DUF1836 domain-containing protein [Cytobacillus purgationiresistens]|uniref:DUF1836 domain-containing protein n=1 Tax=Cytobacillus purgationiresistens TaxID=863449 RepID=A0ABU0ACY3_9BACI|nr:DUF1836 domain-containing protein [Cytobacillus purgationiresistens]MDQ0268293.1 hypothetical protein [Cytobacillus purgationiresistens]
MNELLEELGLRNQITIEDIPEIDLYMDQVIQLFEKKFNDSKRNDEEKLLTKTMINNYAKGKLFFPIKNKKYSKEHIILISLIYQLKGALSINDIKQTLDGVNNRITGGLMELDEFYNGYLDIVDKNVTGFKEEVEKKSNDVNKELESLHAEEDKELEQILLIASLVNMSNLYRRTAEKMIDALGSKEK